MFYCANSWNCSRRNRVEEKRNERIKIKNEKRKCGSITADRCIFVYLLGLGIAFEYVMKIPMGFYNVPIIIAFLAAILVACLQNRKISFDGKLEIMAQGLLIRILLQCF